MSDTVIHGVPFQVIAGPSAGAQGTCVFIYQQDTPYSVWVRFAGTWLNLARDLLAEGVLDGAGEAEIAISPVREGVTFTITRPTYQVILFDSDEICEFLEQTLHLVEQGAEAEACDLDAELARLLRAGA